MRDVGGVALVAQEDVQQDLRAMFRGAIRASLELFLEAELETLVGAEWYARVGGRRDRRNGAYTRRLLTSLGHIAAPAADHKQRGAITRRNQTPHESGGGVSGSCQCIASHHRRRLEGHDNLERSAVSGCVIARAHGGRSGSVKATARSFLKCFYTQLGT